ncbi:hypothetical protein [Gloeothece verrucosa]|uniref:Uncharacterized protein n=1 Tax=Gloeothece verrucosa (strain PCC 7822) TaxID=497965 RepID=E0U7E2_GLOV7|nr:hypothetical protein [Gloeothece verrucosa]ADN12529.1 hypothetical protein Cyan7822_0486 [Gloeothece verrucosa PCC 7822]
MIISPPPVKEPKTSLIQKLKAVTLPLGLIGFGILNGAAGNRVLVIVGVVSGSVAFVQPYLEGKRANRKIKRAFLLILGTLVFALLNLIARPAQAQFFQNAEEFFNTTFTSSGAAIPLVFNTLRALYIVYLAVAFIGVFNSVRQDEDWVAAARTPILVVITVTLADILTGLITG